MTFTDQELQNLSAEIDNQLSELANEPSDEGHTKHIGTIIKAIPSKQKQQLEQATGEEAETYLKKIGRVVKEDLCKEGGLLYKKWQQLGDLDNETLLLTFGGVLSGMGLTAIALQTATVAVSVIVIHISIKVFCEDCE
jgi:hypothetical protein